MKHIVATFVFITSIVYAGENRVDPLSPGFFTRERVDADLMRIAESLRSFHRLNDLITSRSGLSYPFRWPDNAKATVVLGKKDIVDIGNMESDFQTIAFTNMPLYVRGYIDYLEYQNLRLQLQLAEANSEPDQTIRSLQEEIKSKKALIERQYSNWAD